MSSAEKKLVRLIDDDPMVLKAMKSVLVEEGFEVKTYLTAEDFLTEDANSNSWVFGFRLENAEY